MDNLKKNKMATMVLALVLTTTMGIIFQVITYIYAQYAQLPQIYYGFQAFGHRKVANRTIYLDQSKVGDSPHVNLFQKGQNHTLFPSLAEI